jgi:protein gp37
MADTKIEWTDKTWNPVTGCTPISEGCANCYAKRMAARFKGRYGYPADGPFKVLTHPYKLDEPSRWRKPSRIFVVSMGDLFHEDVPILFIRLVLNTIERNPHHTFIILTKRPKRMEEIFNHNSMFVENPNREDGWRFKAPKNLWLGVTAENQARADERIPILLQIPAAVRFVSVEPMLGPVDLGSWVSPTGDLHLKDSRPGDQWAKVMPGLSWVICGCESGPKRRLFYYPWARDLKNQCVSAGVPFFFKQAPHNGKVIPMPDLDGQVWGQYPEAMK